MRLSVAVITKHPVSQIMKTTQPYINLFDERYFGGFLLFSLHSLQLSM